MKTKYTVISVNSSSRIHLMDTTESLVQQAVNAVKGFKHPQEIKDQLALCVLCAAVGKFIVKTYADRSFARELALRNIDKFISEYANYTPKELAKEGELEED